ncbi:MAG TPA: hypothetical protein VKA95_11910 [Nitrososphaeraceae archaeon]|nr:hypothetical protein [Nitrososphaeraceae archaeon]
MYANIQKNSAKKIIAPVAATNVWSNHDPVHNPRFNHDMQLEIDCIEWAL